MANIKFSQFTVGNTESDIDFVVGYKGANNIQISPANLLSSTLSGYLPLAGGTMTGTSGIHMPDNFALKAGNSQDLKIYHDGSNSYIENGSSSSNGNLIIRSKATTRDLIFQGDNGDGSSSSTTYFYLNGSMADIGTSSVYTQFPDYSHLIFGNSSNANSLDLAIYHDGSTSYIKNGTTNFNIESKGGIFIENDTSSDINITNKANDGDIIFYNDDGSGGTAEYFRLNGGLATGGTLYTVFPDNSRATFGNGYDLQIYHDASNSYIKQGAGGNLIIQQETDDGDIIFRSDDGSGGVTTYFQLDGSANIMIGYKSLYMIDDKRLYLGTAGDLEIYHNATDSAIQNNTGDLYISNFQDDGDIIFRSDNGSGGHTQYFRIDGGDENVQFAKNIKLNNGADIFLADNGKTHYGDSNDLEIFHDSNNSYIVAKGTGNLILQQNKDDADISFQCDDGSGSLAEYFRVDGSSVQTIAEKDFRFIDSVKVILGTGSDLQISHDSTDSYIQNATGNLKIFQNANDKDITFYNDDGLGGTTAYFFLDGSRADGTYLYTEFPDNSVIGLGNDTDLQIYHTGTVSLIDNYLGDLIVQQKADDKDILFKCDDGSGGVTTYFQLDGSDGNVKVYKQFGFLDNVKATFGNSGDLQIYHDGSNSYIDELGTGNLRIRSTNTLELLNAAGSKYYASFTDGGSSKLFHNGSEKLETRSTGIKISGVSEYADNTAAIAGGLTTGDVYRTGDLLKIVH